MSNNVAANHSETQATEVTKSSQPSSMLFLDQLDVDVSGTIVVMIGCMWDVSAITGRYLSTDFVVSDSKANIIHCTAKGTVAHNFLRLKEGGIYSIKNFIVQPNKDDFRIVKHATFMLEFDGATAICKAADSDISFLIYPFQLVDFDRIEPIDNKTTYQKSSSRMLDFYLADNRGQAPRVTLWGGPGDVLIEKKTNHAGMCAVVLNSMSVKNYNNKLYLLSSSSTAIYDDESIPTLQELKRQGSVSESNKVMIETVRTKKGWNYPSCGGGQRKKGATRPQNDHMVTPSLTTLLNNSVIIPSNTTIRHDGRVQSYYGLRVRDIDVLCSGPIHLRTSKKPPRKVALTSVETYVWTRVPITYHNIGPPTHECRNFHATMWYEERDDKGKRAVNPIFSLCCQEEIGAIHIVQYTSICAYIVSEKRFDNTLASTVSGVAVLIVNDFGDGLPTRDIIVNTTDSGSKRVSELHPSYMALQCPLLFLYGEDGYHEKIPYHTNTVVYVIEFKKRRQPHAHVLLWLEEHCKWTTPNQIDDIISAELPLPIHDPADYQVVTEYMLHGPCEKDARSKAIKYLFKYLNKGPDRATIVVEENVRSGTSLAPEQGLGGTDMTKITKKRPKPDKIEHEMYLIIQEISEEILQAKGNLMKSIQTFLEKFNRISFGEMPKVLLRAWEKFFAIQHAQQEDTNELFQKLLEDLQIINEELAEYINPPSWNRYTFYNDDEEHSIQYKEYLENSSNAIAATNFNQEKEEPPENFDIRQLIREECGIKVCEKQKQNMEDTMLELLEVCRQNEFYCMHNDVDDLIESALNSKLLSINLRSQQSLQNFRVIHKKRSISLNNTSQISLVNVIAPILPTEEPEYSLSMGYENLSTTLETESDEVIKSSVKNLIQIPREYEVTSNNESECDVPVCEDSSTFDVLKDHYEILSDSNNDDISSDGDAFEDIEYVEASLLDSELVSLEEENDVYQEEKEFDLEDILQIQDIILHKKLLSINRLIADIEFLNDNPTPDRVLKSSFSFPIFENTKETRSGSTTTHANNSLPEYDSFCFEIEPDQGRLTSVVMKNISDNSTNDPLLEEVNLFLASDNSIPPGIENFDYDSEGDIHFLEELLVNYSISLPENESSNFDHHDYPSFPRPLPEPPDVEFFFDFEVDSEELIAVVINNIDELNEDECFDLEGGEIDVFANIKDDNIFSFIFVIRIFLPYLTHLEVSPLLLSNGSEDTIFDPGIST
nr:hypothetical protein [Tanacetum cinerariifolium]